VALLVLRHGAKEGHGRVIRLALLDGIHELQVALPGVFLDQDGEIERVRGGEGT
jgi:hypothetical protein